MFLAERMLKPGNGYKCDKSKYTKYLHIAEKCEYSLCLLLQGNRLFLTFSEPITFFRYEKQS